MLRSVFSPASVTRRRFLGGMAAMAAVAVLTPSLLGNSAAASTASNAPDRATNVILMVPDGMGETHVIATRYLYQGRDGRLSMERMPVFNQVSTYSANNLVTDSAAAATAFATGVLANNGSIAVDPAGESVLDRSLLIRAQEDGKSTGLITEVQLAHATPAPFAASVPSRRMMNEIAEQYLANEVNVLLGGGESNFVQVGTAGAHCEATQTKRTDDRNLLTEAAESGYEVVTDRASLLGAQATDGRLLGLFACENMAYDLDRPAHEPTSAEKTEKALEVLSRNPEGFFLVVERGKVDWAAEGNDSRNTMGETRAFDQAVEVALEFAASNPETLVVVMADHEAGGMSLVFESRARNLEDDAFTSADGRPMFINWATQPGHTGVPVGVRAQGPGSEAIRNMNGTGHFTDVYRVILEAMGLGG